MADEYVYIVHGYDDAPYEYSEPFVTMVTKDEAKAKECLNDLYQKAIEGEDPEDIDWDETWIGDTEAHIHSYAGDRKESLYIVKRKIE